MKRKKVIKQKATIDEDNNLITRKSLGFINDGDSTDVSGIRSHTPFSKDITYDSKLQSKRNSTYEQLPFNKSCLRKARLKNSSSLIPSNGFVTSQEKSISFPTEPDSGNDENTSYSQRHSQRDMKVLQLFRKYVYNRFSAEIWKHRPARGKIKVKLFLTK